ncbi:MAG: ion transporter [Pseudomonadota bacterium]|nr:ion transporter [Pseudomonadota bacterium]
MADALRRITESRRFQNFIIGVIFLSSLLVGLESYPYVRNHYGHVIRLADQVILLIFTVEIIMRIGAHGRRPGEFFRSGWNVFDFAIVALCYLPATRFMAVLRLARILRILRLVATIRESEIIRQKNRELTEAYRQLEAEKARSERLLLNVLPALVAQRLKARDSIIADSFPEASVLFGDLVGFTRLSSQVSPEALVAVLDDVFSRFDRLAEQYGVEKIKTIGDAYMVVAGIPEPRPDHAEVLANMALDMLAELAASNRDRGWTLDIRIGIHSGPIVAGVIGRKKFIYDLWGDTVNTASRMESHGLPGRIQATEEVYRRLRDTFVFEPRGVIEVKGKGEMKTWFLTGRRPQT